MFTFSHENNIDLLKKLFIAGQIPGLQKLELKSPSKFEKMTYRHSIYNYEHLDFLGNSTNFGNIVLFLNNMERFLDTKLEIEQTDDFLSFKGTVSANGEDGPHKYWAGLIEIPETLRITELSLDYLNAFFATDSFIGLENFKISFPLFTPKNLFFGHLYNLSQNFSGPATLSERPLSNQSLDLGIGPKEHRYLTKGRFFNGTAIKLDYERSDLSEIFKLC